MLARQLIFADPGSVPQANNAVFEGYSPVTLTRITAWYAFIMEIEVISANFMSA